MENCTIFARIGDYGREVYAVEFPWDGELNAADVSFTGFVDEKDPKERTHADISGIREKVVLSAGACNGAARVEVMPFLYERDFMMYIGGTAYDVKKGAVKTDWLDEFSICRSEEGVDYRFFEPKNAGGPRPLILFLHGGGGQGTDNELHMTECYGAANIAEMYPWCYVMAPQLHPLPGPRPSVKKTPEWRFSKAGGWDQDYLARIGDEIRRLIACGKVDKDRVYVTGLSMGGAGTILCLNTNPDLFAAAVTICPTMAEDTYDILRNLTHTKIWVVCSYVDHWIFRHKYLTDAVNELKEAGNRDARLTIYSPEELAEFGVGDTDDITQAERIAWNHWVWLPVYKGDKGIMSWMLNQYKG